MSPAEIARELATKAPREIDLQRDLSHGIGAAKTMIDEGRGAPSVSFSIKNETTEDVAIVIGKPEASDFGRTALLTLLGAQTALNDGVIYTAGGKDVTVTSNDPGRNVASLMNYSGNTPFRFLSASLDSSKVAGGIDTSNYSSQIKSAWVSPFQKPKEIMLGLRQFQTNQSTAVQFVDINFVKVGFLAMLSKEHFLVITVKAGTELTATFLVGAQLSLAQRAYRAYNAADSVLKGLKG